MAFNFDLSQPEIAIGLAFVFCVSIVAVIMTKWQRT
jgi:hypothetical protein